MREKPTTTESIFKFRGESCLNCGLPLDRCDNFCSKCGQKNTLKKLSFGDFFSELFSGLFSYDSRFQRTLRVMLFRPGKISKDYIEGKRVRYANPFRFYLSISILFFLIFGFNLNPSESIGNAFKDSPESPSEIINQEFRNAKLDSINKLAPNLLPEVDSLQAEKIKKSYQSHYFTQKQLDSMSLLKSLSSRAALYYHFHDETNIINSTIALDSLKHTPTRFNNWIYKKTVDAGTIIEKPVLFINYFIGKLPFIIFFFLPVFALFIWLLYLRRSYNYMEHLIFAFHIQTMFFVLYAIAMLFEIFIIKGYALSIANIIFLFYLYKGMRNFYAQSRVKTILKFLLLNIIFFTLAVIVAIFSLLASFTLY